MHQLLKILIIIIFFVPVLATALPEDSTENMHIVADSTLFNYKSGLNVYQGNVKVEQGVTRLNADRVTTQSNAHHKMEEAIAYGEKNLADYWTIPRKDDPIFHAQAKTIKFYPIKAIVVLEGDVVVTQGGNSFHGPLIIYNIKDQTISSPATNKGRATIMIQPTKIKI